MNSAAQVLICDGPRGSRWQRRVSSGPARVRAGDAGTTPNPQAGAHRVRFTLSGHEILVPAGESILEAALSAGVDLPFSCTVGGCGTCKQRLVSGSVTMNEPNCLETDERAQGWFLPCCAYPAQAVEVDA